MTQPQHALALGLKLKSYLEHSDSNRPQALHMSSGCTKGIDSKLWKKGRNLMPKDSRDLASSIQIGDKCFDGTRILTAEWQHDLEGFVPLADEASFDVEVICSEK